MRLMLTCLKSSAMQLGHGEIYEYPFSRSYTTDGAYRIPPLYIMLPCASLYLEQKHAGAN
jgi:hypothetical protein